MTTDDFITYLFSDVDDKLNEEQKNQKHSQANLYPSEVVEQQTQLAADNPALVGDTFSANLFIASAFSSGVD